MFRTGERNMERGITCRVRLPHPEGRHPNRNPAVRPLQCWPQLRPHYPSRPCQGPGGAPEGPGEAGVLLIGEEVLLPSIRHRFPAWRKMKLGAQLGTVAGGILLALGTRPTAPLGRRHGGPHPDQSHATK